jgi:hypothetical protein
LYNLAGDLGETRDLAAERPEVLRRLSTAWTEIHQTMAPTK